VDDYFGTKVTDNYRWMEISHSAELAAWMKAQNDYTRAVLASIPGRAKLLARIKELDRSAPPVFAFRAPDDRYLIIKRAAPGGTLNLYLRQGLHGTDRLLVDAAAVKLSASAAGKGANTITFIVPSPDGHYVAVALAPGGSARDTEIHVFDTTTGRETGDVLPRAISRLFFDFKGWWTDKWLPDGRAFVYLQGPALPAGAPATEAEQKVTCRLHVLGTNPSNDPVVFGYGAAPSIHVDLRSACDVAVTPGLPYVVGRIHLDDHHSAFYIESVTDLGKTNTAWRRIADFSDGVSDVAIHGSDLYFLTRKGAPRLKVVRTDVVHPDLAAAETVVPPSQAVVESMHAAKDALYVQLLDGGISRMLRVPYGPHPRVEEIALPYQGAIRTRQADPRIPGMLMALTTWTRANQYYAYDPVARRVIGTGLQPRGPYDDPADLTSVEVQVRSHDGAMVPLSIVYRKGIKLDGSNPAWLEGYGNNGISLLPDFQPIDLAWYEQGGIYAVCHARGGGEYGDPWRLGGQGPTKANTWRDFIACAQYLIEKKYTSPAHLAGMGVSAGGILVGRAITERPDLFAAAIDSVGLTDTLRVETEAHGTFFIRLGGDVKTKAGFDALYAMSAYAHVQDGTRYPAVLLLTGINDPRNDPWQVAKMAARLQAATASGKPVLLRVDYHGGHGASPITASERQIEESWADQWSFLLWQLGAPGFQPRK
jgi:prolyl oligopeptidase